MSWLSRLLRRDRLEAQLDSELRDHFDRLVADHLAAGMSEAEARRRARLEFGGLDQVKELCRDARGTRWLEDAAQDARYAARLFRRSPGFAAVAVATLAIGIGANMAVFGLINALLLRPLPVRDPGGLVQLLRVYGPASSGENFSYPQVLEIAARSDVLSAVCAFAGDGLTVGAADAPEPASGAWVTGSYYSTLGVSPAAGRLLNPEDDRPGASPVAVISDGYWRRRFGGDPAAVGRTLVIDGTAVPIVGVSAPGFTGAIVGAESEITLALNARPQLQPHNKFFLGRGAVWLKIMARPREGLAHEQVRAALSAEWNRRRIEALPANASAEARAIAQASTLGLQSGARGASSLRSQFRQPLVASMILVTLVLLIACVNIANLLLARTATRQREMALRLAIGAGRGRLMRLLFTESALLSAAGVGTGLAVAALGTRALVALLAAAQGGRVMLDVALDWRMFVFTAAVAVATTLLFGTMPALRAAHVAPAAAMNEGSSRIAGPRGRMAMALVSAQVALSLLLLVGAGLFIRTLQNLRTLDRGFRHEQVLLAGIDGSRMGLTPAALKAFNFEALAFAARLPGVTAASLAQVTPLLGGGITQAVAINGRPADGELHFNNVSPRYFETLRTPVVLGREFTMQDAEGTPLVAVVNEAFARAFLPDGSPLGQRVSVGGRPGELQIVGVVRDAVYESLRQAPPPTVYAAFLQRGSGDATLVIHAPGALPAVASAIRGYLQPRLNGRPLRVRTLSAQLETSLARERMMAIVAGVFGALALLLAAVGLYGLLTYWVARRTREVGIRLALGATRPAVIWLVLRDAVRMLAIGCAVGLPAAWALSRLVEAMLFGVTGDDVATMGGALAVLALTGLAAAWFPARRATLINPTDALRAE